MKTYRIKNNYRYVIYEDMGQYYLVDVYDYWWITIIFPFVAWYLYHKAYPLTEKEFLNFEIKEKKEINLYALGGIMLMVSPIIIFGFDNSLYIPNIIDNSRLFHALILMFLVIVCLFIYIKYNYINLKLTQKPIYIKIYPSSIFTSILCHFGYPVLLILPAGVFIIPFALSSSKYLLNISYLSFSILSIFIIINITYAYMENNGPYNYKIKEING